MAIQGIKNNDFTGFPLADVGVSVSRTPITQKEDMISGDEILEEGTATTITAYIVRRKQKWEFDKEGKIEGGDGILMTATTTTINVNDMVTYKGDKFRVETVIVRMAGDIEMFKSCNLFLIE